MSADAGPEVIAAVDLGSNSFHMVVGELRHGQLAIIDRLKETVRLAEGLKDDGDLSRAASRRALQCLGRFGQRLRDMHAATVRAAGTSTLRRARDSAEFLKEGEQALGHPIEIISGIEEARLIYKGVRHSLPPRNGSRLVLDIGGGSTELIAGVGETPQALESLHLGCVAMTEQYFPRGRISRRGFEKARLAARLEIAPVRRFFRDAAREDAIGTSGTILATAAVARETEAAETAELTPGAVHDLVERVLAFGNISELNLPGLPPARAEVWPGGLAILAELFGMLGIARLRISDGGLREGLLYDQLGRLQHEDARERSVQAMALRYSIDAAQADRVAKTAAALLEQCARDWQLDSELVAKMLEWAARLHEVGLDISHDGYQRHGAYIVANADLPGFPHAEQQMLAFLIASQRRDIDRRAARKLPAAWRTPALKLAVLLRLAVLLNRTRSGSGPPAVTLKVGKSDVRLKFARGWLRDNPLTEAELARERGYLRKAAIGLRFS